YQRMLAFGGLKDAMDVDAFSFTVPMDASAATNGRTRAEIWLQPNGSVDGDGSTSPVISWVTDDMGTIIAQIDQKNYKNGDDAMNGAPQLSVPVAVGKTYYLFTKGGTGKPDTDFYYYLAFVGGFYFGEVETADATNGTSAGAQVLTP